MGVALGVKVEMSFDGGGSWTDVTSDVRASDGIRCRRGLSDAWITDRIAQTGVLQLALDNRAQRYAPDSSNARVGFGIGTPIRLVLSSPVLPGRSFYVWRGRITKIDVEPGPSARRTWITAADWFEEAARQPTPRLSVLTKVRADQVVSALLAASPRPPRAMQLQQGSDVYPLALDSSPSERGTLYQELAKFALSELGYCYLRGDESGGETFVFENRRYRPRQSTDLAVLTDTMHGLQLARAAEDVYNEVAFAAVPSRADTTATVLYTLETRPRLRAGQPLIFDVPYRDPSQRAQRVGGRDMIQPVAGTDYTANSAEDGSGSDRTSALSVSVIFWATMARVTVTSSVDAYLTKFQLRGIGLYRYERILAVKTDADSQTIYGVRELTVDLPYQTNVDSAEAGASYIVLLSRTPETRVAQVELLANASSELMAQALLRDISDRVRISESVSSVSAPYFIQSVEWEIDAGPMGRVRWRLAPAARLRYWVLGQAGSSELGVTTFLAPSIAHGDAPHSDHTDSTHTDTQHGDAAHADTAHGDVAHQDTAHSDVAHSDSHSDVAHADSTHSDTPHSDSPHGDAAHADTAHSDTAHSDVPHDDSHGDTAHGDAHDDTHEDAGEPRPSPGHADSHTDSHADVPHDDSHGDTAHGDTAHSDVAHEDAAHADSPHGDTAHSDATHGDTAHSDTHSDVAHQDVAHADSHTDSPHQDAAHADSPHGDTHSDTPHDDVAHIDQ